MRIPSLTIACCFFALTAFAGEPQIIGEKNGRDVVTVRVGDASTSKQALPFFPGVSDKNAGAKNLSLLKVVIPPGGSAQAHIHKGYESRRSICCKARWRPNMASVSKRAS